MILLPLAAKFWPNWDMGLAEIINKCWVTPYSQGVGVFGDHCGLGPTWGQVSLTKVSSPAVWHGVWHFYVWYPPRKTKDETQISLWFDIFRVIYSEWQHVKLLSWTESWPDKETRGSKLLVTEKRIHLDNIQSSDYLGLRGESARPWRRHGRVP